jgi:hypothetical protein
MHTRLNLHGSIFAFIHLTDGKAHDMNVFDEIAIKGGAFNVMERGCIDFEQHSHFTLESAFFVVRTPQEHRASAALLASGQEDHRLAQ